MKVIGFNFNKISIEKKGDSKGGLKINAEIDVSEINNIKTDIFKSKDEILEAKFTYKVNYDPNIASVDLSGSVVMSMNLKQSKEVLKEWKKKKMPDEFKIGLFNVISRKAALKALELEDEMNLPLHVPMPSLRKQDK